MQLTFHFDNNILDDNKSKIDLFREQFKQINWEIYYLQKSIIFVWIKLIKSQINMSSTTSKQNKSKKSPNWMYLNKIATNVDFLTECLVYGYIRILQQLLYYNHYAKHNIPKLIVYPFVYHFIMKESILYHMVRVCLVLMTGNKLEKQVKDVIQHMVQ